MRRSAIVGSAVFGIGSFVAGYVWTTFEFPFVVLVPWFAGWVAVAWPLYGRTRALVAGAVGGVTYTVAWLFLLALALTDGSPLPLAGWLVAPAGAAVAGALTGAVLERGEGARMLALSSALGSLAGSAALQLMRGIAIPGVDTPGMAQTLWFSVAQGVSGVFIGAAVGAAVAAVHHRLHAETSSMPSDAESAARLD